MTAEAFRHHVPSPAVGLALFKQTLACIGKTLGYVLVLAAYASIFIVSIATLALIEIRRANLKDFDALIAILEQRELYFTNKRLEQELTSLARNIAQYRQLDTALPCSGKPSKHVTGQTAAMGTVPEIANGGASAGQAGEPESCAEVKTIANKQLYRLLSLQDNLTFLNATLPKFYDEYTDGLRDKAPQLIPLLRYVDSNYEVVTAWARLPLELLEMLLLVSMGALGGVIAVTRCFVDMLTPNPTARDLCYRPVVGAVIALGIYVVFRAMQLFFGASSQDNTAAVSTSVFLLAALGLASGFCAREAVAVIQVAATRILQRAESGRDDDHHRGTPT